MTNAPQTPEPVEEAQLPTVVPASAETEAAIASRGLTLYAQIDALVIESDADLDVASEHLSNVRALRREIDGDFGEPARAARKLWEMIRERFTKYDNPAKDVEATLKDKGGAYHQKRARERQAQIDAAARQAESRKVDDEARLAEAEQLEAAGDHEAAAAVLDEAPTPAPPATVDAPPTKGMSVRETWKAEITSIDKLIEAAGKKDGEVARSILSDPKVVKAATSVASIIAKGMKANMKVPGVRAYPDTTVAGGKR